MTEQLPTIINDRTGIIADTRAHIVPALIAAAGETRRAAFSGILRGQHPQPAHATRLQPRRIGIYGLV